MKVLIVGLGSIAAKHITALRQIDPGVEIHALRSQPDAPCCKGVTNIYGLEDGKDCYDFVIISNPTSLHARTVQSLLKLRVPLFVEKPVFGELEHEGLIDNVKQSGIINYVACNLRFLDSLQHLHDYIQSNPHKRINEVNVYCGSYLPEWRPGTDWKNCYSAVPEMGGGVNFDLIHELDYVCWIFGKPFASSSLFRNVSSLGIKAVDYASYTLLYPGFTASVVLNYYRRDYKRTLEVVFDDETWTVDLKENIIKDSTGKTIYNGKNAPADTYYAQMRYFVELVKTGRKAENDMAAAYEVLKICIGDERSGK